MKYLLLGGNGFIGQNIANKICSGHETVIADRLFTPGLFANTKLQHQKIDFTTENFTSLLEGVDVVFHLVSTVLPSDGTDNIADEIKENVLPTIRLLDAMVLHKTPKIVFFSTGGIIYGQGSNMPSKETDILQPICKYGVHKLAIEKYLHLYNVYHDLDYCVIRPSNPYSSKIYLNKPQGIIPLLINQIVLGEAVNIWGDGSIKRDFIHINDVMKALEAVIDYKGAERVFNIGTGESTSINDVIMTITDAVNDITQKNHIPKINYLNARICDVAHNKLDISLLNKCTGWKPAISLKKGINMCISERIKRGTV